MPDKEWDFYHMDQRINDRGVRIDTELVRQAIACDLMLSDEMSRRAYALTGLENPNSVSQLKSWLETRGIEVVSLGKKDVAAMITDLDRNSCDQEALDMLKLRLQMAGRGGYFSFTALRGRDASQDAISSYRISRRTISPHWMKRGSW